MARPRKTEEFDIPAAAIEAAISLLSEEAAQSVTIKRIAQRIGCSGPALYRYFASKDVLLKAVHDAGFERLYQTKLDLLKGHRGPALDRLRAGGMAYLSFALDNPALYRLMFMPPKIAGLADNPFSGDIGMKSLDYLVSSIRACQAEGAIPPVDPSDLAFTLWSSVHGTAMLLIENRAPVAGEAREPVAERTVDMIIGLLSGRPGANRHGG